MTLKDLAGYGFKLGAPLFWAMYDGFNGVETLASDGTIAWVDPLLVEFVRRSAAEEYDTFEAAELMCKSVGKECEVLLPYQAIAKAKGLKAHEAAGSDGAFIYLVKFIKSDVYEVKAAICTEKET